MNTRIVKSSEELLALKQMWTDLVDGNPSMNCPFFAWDWFHCSWKHFSPKANLFVLLVEDEGRLVGVLPLIQTKERKKGFLFSVLRFANTGITPRNTFLVDVNLPSEKYGVIYETALGRLFKERREWQIVEFANIPINDRFHKFLACIANGVERAGTKQEFAIIQGIGRSSPFIALESSYDDYFKKYGNKDARRRYTRNTEKFSISNQVWEVKIYSSELDIQEGLEMALAVRKESWKGVFQNPSYPAFYREISDILSKEQRVCIFILMLDEKPIAAQYFIVRDKKYYLLTNDFDLKYKETSPGVCLLHFVIMQAFKEKFELIDFTGNNHNYKMNSATGTREHSSFELFHSGLISHFIYWGKTKILPLIRRVWKMQ